MPFAHFSPRRARLTAATLGLAASIAIAPCAPARADLGPCMATFKATQALNSYRTTVTSMRDGTARTTFIDIVKPDKIHMKSDRTEMIAIGKKTWMRAGSSGFAQMPGMDMKAAFSMANDYIKNDKDDSCTDGGMGSYHGQPAHIFKLTRSDGKMVSHSTAYVFGDGLVHHVDSTSSLGPSSVDFTEFNSASVNAPH